VILTAARTGELLGAKWNEIDLHAATWTIPAERMKTGKPHRVPLASAAIELLAGLPKEEGNPYIFIGAHGGGMSDTSLIAVLRRMERKDFTIHGFRSSFRDWGAERTNYQNHVLEMALSHAVGNAVEAAYRRGDMLDKRRRLMADWASYCTSPPVETGGVLVPIRAKA
jgi:integrase